MSTSQFSGTLTAAPGSWPSGRVLGAAYTRITGALCAYCALYQPAARQAHRGKLWFVAAWAEHALLPAL